MNISRFTDYTSRLAPHATYFIALFVFVATFALYRQTLAPTLGGGDDSAEFQHVAYTLGIAHPTGYPLYLALGKITTTLLPLGNIAYRMNMLSALLGALAAAFVYLSIVSLVQRHWSALVATALFVTNVAVWRQAGVASTSPLNLLLFAALMYALLRWHQRRAGLLPVAFILGLGLAHHRSIILIAPAILILLLLDDFNILRRPREWTRLGIALATPLLFYLYLPLFGNWSPWYSNTLEGFFAQIAGSEANSYMRVTHGDWVDALVTLARFLFESFGILGGGLIALGIWRFVPRFNRRAELARDARVAIFLGVATLTYAAWAILYDGEPDRLWVLPFFFLIYWLALGSTFIENILASRGHGMRLVLLGMLLIALIGVPFAERMRAADWSSYTRVYKQWDEIFTLPIPFNATIVGNWEQLNAMRYLQRIENRRTDLQLVGTMYDPTPQTDAARAAFADGRAIFLAPGVALPRGEYRYAQLGPLLEVRDAPQMNAPVAPKHIALGAALTLADFSVTTALEPYAPTTRIAPNRTARVTLDWRAEDRVADFLVRVRVYDPDGRAIVQRDAPPVRGLYPASRWSHGEYVRDVHNIQIPAGTPPGTYQVKLQLVDAETKSPLGDEIALASFAVERATNLPREQVFSQHTLNVPMLGGIRLCGYSGENTYRSGEKITLALVWCVTGDVGTLIPAHFEIYLWNSTGVVARRVWRDPIQFYPTLEWQKGEILKAYYDLQLPDHLPPGEYTLGAILHWDYNAPNIGKIKIAP